MWAATARVARGQLAGFPSSLRLAGLAAPMEPTTLLTFNF